jgi:hypothetical protein
MTLLDLIIVQVLPRHRTYLGMTDSETHTISPRVPVCCSESTVPVVSLLSFSFFPFSILLMHTKEYPLAIPTRPQHPYLDYKKSQKTMTSHPPSSLHLSTFQNLAEIHPSHPASTTHKRQHLANLALFLCLMVHIPRNEAYIFACVRNLYCMHSKLTPPFRDVMVAGNVILRPAGS